MAWTAPRTWVTGETVTAALMNAHIKDNLLETAAAKAATAGGYFVATGTNTLVERVAAEDFNGGGSNFTSTSYTTTGSAGADVTLTTGTSAFVSVGAHIWHDSAGEKVFVGYAVSGASTVAAGDGAALMHESSAGGNRMAAVFSHLRTGLTAGSNTFTTEWRVDTGTGNVDNTTITVIPF